jgi:hypothetical protein
MKTYGLNDSGPEVLRLQRYMNEVFLADNRPDGVLGKVTQATLKRLQIKLGIVEDDESGPCYGPVTQSKVLDFINKKYLTEEDFQRASVKSGLEVNIVKAVTEVEAVQFGFFSTGAPVVLFERHHFYRLVRNLKGTPFANKLSIDNPDICSPEPGGYVGGKRELLRLNKARAIDDEAALKSASYGLFQIMGFNHEQAGYDTVRKYYNAMCQSEDNQLDAFVNYLISDKDKTLITSLKKKDFASFAREYNGSAYKKNNYDVKILNAYNKLSSV